MTFDFHWPRIPCKIYRRKNQKDTIIRVGAEHSPTTFGMISNESAGAIAALYDGLARGPLRFQAFILPQPKKEGTGSMHMILEFEVIIYGKPSQFQAVGDLLSTKNIYLSQPSGFDKNTRYQNPHYHIKQQRARTGVLVQPRYQDVTKTAEEIQQEIDSVFDKVMASEVHLQEKESPNTIVTQLYLLYFLVLI